MKRYHKLEEYTAKSLCKSLDKNIQNTSQLSLGLYYDMMLMGASDEIIKESAIEFIKSKPIKFQKTIHDNLP